MSLRARQPGRRPRFVLDAGPTLGESHQQWQMNEINGLTWPTAAQGVGIMDTEAFQRTVDISLEFGIIENPPDAGAFRTDLAQAAVKRLRDDGIDVLLRRIWRT